MLSQLQDIVATIMLSKEADATTFSVYSRFIFVTSSTKSDHTIYLDVAASLKIATDLVPSLQLVFVNI
jgi:hypothetical protein